MFTECFLTIPVKDEVAQRRLSGHGGGRRRRRRWRRGRGGGGGGGGGLAHGVGAWKTVLENARPAHERGPLRSSLRPHAVLYLGKLDSRWFVSESERVLREQAAKLSKL